MTVAEAELMKTEAGLIPHGEGWFVLNAREASWIRSEERGQDIDFEGEQEWTQLGFRIQVMAPGQRSMYHGERGQEDFLVVSGECVLVIECEERRLKAWDFVHCPPWTEHVFVGAGGRRAVCDRHGRQPHRWLRGSLPGDRGCREARCRRPPGDVETEGGVRPLGAGRPVSVPRGLVALLSVVIRRVPGEGVEPSRPLAGTADFKSLQGSPTPSGCHGFPLYYALSAPATSGSSPAFSGAPAVTSLSPFTGSTSAFP